MSDITGVAIAGMNNATARVVNDVQRLVNASSTNRASSSSTTASEDPNMIIAEAFLDIQMAQLTYAAGASVIRLVGENNRRLIDILS